MCKDLQENKINKMKFHEEIDQFNNWSAFSIPSKHKNYVHESRKTLSHNYELW